MKKKHLKLTSTTTQVKTDYIDPYPYEVGFLILVIAAMCVQYFVVGLWQGIVYVLEFPAVWALLWFGSTKVRRYLLIGYTLVTLTLGITSLCIKHRIIGFHYLGYVQMSYTPCGFMLLVYCCIPPLLANDFPRVNIRVSYGVLIVTSFLYLLVIGSVNNDNNFKHRWLITFRDKSGNIRTMINRSAFDPHDLYLTSKGYLINEESQNLDGDGTIAEIIDAKTIDNETNN